MLPEGGMVLAVGAGLEKCRRETSMTSSLFGLRLWPKEVSRNKAELVVFMGNAFRQAQGERNESAFL